MGNYFIGYKQGNGEYIYVNSINNSYIGVTLDTNGAMDFISEEIATNICEFLNLKDTEKTYLPLLVRVDVTEIIEEADTDVITNE